MARKKKVVEPIVGPGKDPENKLTVQKSNPLLSLWRSDMSLAEFKILDTYLSRINSREPDKRTVVFTKGELEQLLGVKKINKASLLSRLKGLYRGVEIEDSNKKIRTVGLFEETYGGLDEETGLWTVQLTCTPSAMKYIFNIEKLGYLRYKLRCITSLSSRYAYILFLYLEKNRTMHLSWEVDVDELRLLLNCDTEPTYAQFKRFNDLVLKKCQKELHEKTECRFEYVPIKKGRKVTAVRFILESIAVMPVVDAEQLSMFEGSADPIEAVAAVLPAGFTREQVQAIYTAASPVAAGLYGVATPTPGQVMGYLQSKMGKLMAYDAREPIKHKDTYLLHMIENDLSKLAKEAPRASGRRELDEDEQRSIQRMLIQKVLDEPDDEPVTVGNNPELAARAAELKENLQSK